MHKLWTMTSSPCSTAACMIMIHIAADKMCLRRCGAEASHLPYTADNQNACGYLKKHLCLEAANDMNKHLLHAFMALPVLRFYFQFWRKRLCCWWGNISLNCFMHSQPHIAALGCSLRFHVWFCAADDVDLDCFKRVWQRQCFWVVVRALTGWYWACHRTMARCFLPRLCQWSCSGEQWSRRCRPPSELPAMHTAPHKRKIRVTSNMY